MARRFQLALIAGLVSGSLACISWRITQQWRLRVGAGAVAYQKYTVSDTRGNSFDSASSNDPAFTGNFELEFRF